MRHRHRQGAQVGALPAMRPSPFVPPFGRRSASTSSGITPSLLLRFDSDHAVAALQSLAPSTFVPSAPLESRTYILGQPSVPTQFFSFSWDSAHSVIQKTQMVRLFFSSVTTEDILA